MSKCTCRLRETFDLKFCFVETRVCYADAITPKSTEFSHACGPIRYNKLRACPSLVLLWKIQNFA